MAGPNSTRVAFETARLRLARQQVGESDALGAALAHAALVSAVALQIERVSVWRFSEDRTRLRCECLLTLSSGVIADGEELEVATIPGYMAALEQRRVIAVSDVRVHPATRELARYFAAHDIKSVLDAPILSGGSVVGVVCHEQVKTARTFDQQEVDFAASVADILTLIDEQGRRLELEIELRAQDNLREQVLKLEALARLARAAAHDFNNVLSAVTMTADMLREHPDAQVAEHAAVLRDATALGTRIARELLVLGREAPMDAQRVPLRPLVEGLLPMLRSRHGSRCTFTLRCALEEPAARADSAQIERAIMNLCTNGADAIEQGGKVEITIRAPHNGEVHGPGWLVVEVADDGTGMSEHVKSHLYEPYFTTKQNGTGVGLASVYATMRQLGGRVLIDSEPNRGTRVRLILPSWT